MKLKRDPDPTEKERQFNELGCKVSSKESGILQETREENECVVDDAVLQNAQNDVRLNSQPGFQHQEVLRP